MPKTYQITRVADRLVTPWITNPKFDQRKPREAPEFVKDPKPSAEVEFIEMDVIYQDTVSGETISETLRLATISPTLDADLKARAGLLLGKTQAAGARPVAGPPSPPFA